MGSSDIETVAMRPCHTDVRQAKLLCWENKDVDQAAPLNRGSNKLGFNFGKEWVEVWKWFLSPGHSFKRGFPFCAQVFWPCTCANGK